MSTSYPRLSIEEFGKVLLDSNDLDPVYCALRTCMETEVMDSDHLNRWVLAYSCLYHCGAASYLSELEGAAFFGGLIAAAKNELPAPTGERWPRGHERRHWRGGQAIDSAVELAKRYYQKPESFLGYVVNGDGLESPTTFAKISERVREHRGFGGWIAFKLADMVDRLALRKVAFQFDDVVIYKDPLVAAERLARERLGLPENAQVKREVVRDVFTYVEEYFSNYSAPPLHDRPIGLPESESILCKMKSHVNGHYPLYNDIREIREGLLPWIHHSEVASFFHAAMPKLPSELAA